MILLVSPKPGFDVETQVLLKEGRDFLGWSDQAEIKLYDIYQFENCSQAELGKIQETLFDPLANDFLHSYPENLEEGLYFRYRQLTGQYNEREKMSQDLLNHIVNLPQVILHHSRLLVFKNLSQDQVLEFQNYIINPVENVVIPLDAETPVIPESDTEELEEVENFIDFSEEELKRYSKNFSMGLDDLLVCQRYFKEEARNPKLTELKVIDTYWSDHCRHTTFNTHIDEIEIEDGPYKELFSQVLKSYIRKREDLGRNDRPLTLMDMGTIQSKYLRAIGVLKNVEISAEINACSLEIKVDVDGEEEDWLLYFKNETHNHPTEIEPFGGASTCVGGAVRDPLSGRAWVYQAMRISGSKNPNLDFADKHPDKLHQRRISQKALEGNKDYSNQIGLMGGYAREIFHPGFEAKRLEAGAMIAAAPQVNVKREEPVPGDFIILLGGRTGKDGLGAAVGSSQIQTEESLEEAGAEVQKGAPAIERKISRLFRKGEASRLIKRCNDFGAGGVAVAVGELADGLDIHLDKVPVKYEGMHGGEIALSESQERMAVVIDPQDLDEFLGYCQEEDIEASLIAQVTDDGRMTMYWQGEKIIDLSRAFLDSNGADKHAAAYLCQPKEVFINEVDDNILWSADSLKDYMSDLNRANQKAINQEFDGSIGRASVLFPYGGRDKETQELGMVAKLPVPGGKTKSTSGMAYAYDPYLSEGSPFHGGYQAVVDSVSKMVAMGFDYKDIRLSFQEFFERLEQDPKRWGKPVLALMGANLAMDGLELASIGGKDSMSGSFEDIDVPPSLISFAVAPGSIKTKLSRAFKEVDSTLICIENPLDEKQVIDLDLQVKIYERIHHLAQEGKILAASTVGVDGLLRELIEMSYGNKIGFKLEGEDKKLNLWTQPMMGAFLLEIDQNENIEELLKDLPYRRIGKTQEAYMSLAGEDIRIDEVLQASKEVFDSVFIQAEKKIGQEDIQLYDQPFEAEIQTKRSQAKALVPVLLGTNGEYDLQYALEDAGFNCQVQVIADSSQEKFEASIDVFLDNLKDTDLLAFPNGFIFGSQLHDPARPWEIILKREDVKKAIQQHLEDKKLILGLGSSFAALIRTGLIEYGEITGHSHIQVKPNKYGKFVSDLLESKVVSNKSAFTKELLGETYTAPIATSFGQIDLGEAKNLVFNQGQVIAVFKDYYGESNIDALTSPNGLVLGCLSSIERVSQDLFVNIDKVQPSQIFSQAFKYLTL